jgi:hypothetical protein
MLLPLQLVRLMPKLLFSKLLNMMLLPLQFVHSLRQLLSDPEEFVTVLF